MAAPRGALEGDAIGCEPVTDLDLLRELRIDFWESHQLTTPLQPAEIEAGLTDADIEAHYLTASTPPS